MKGKGVFLFFVLILVVFGGFLLYKSLVDFGHKAKYEIRAKDFVDLRLKPEIITQEFLAIKELNKENRYAFLYYGEDGGLYYYNDKNIILNKPLLDKYKGVFNFIDYEIEGDDLYVVQWLRNPPTKLTILIKTNIEGQNPEYVLLGEGAQPLGKPKIVGDGKGNLLIAWSDESNGYGVAYALLSQKGKKIEKQGILRPASIPINYETYTPFYSPEEGFVLVYTTDKDIRARRISDDKEKVLYSFKPNEIQNTAIYILGKKQQMEIYLWTKEGSDTEKPTYKLSYFSYTNPMREPAETKEIKYDRGGQFIWPVYTLKHPFFFTTALPKETPKDEDAQLLGVRQNILYSIDGKEFKRATEGDKFNDYTYSQFYIWHDGDKDTAMLLFLDKRYMLPQLWVSYIRDGKVVGYGPIEKPWVETPVFGSVVHVKDSIYRVYYLHKKQDGRTVLRAVDIDGEKLHNPYPYPSLSEREKRLKEDLERFSQCQVKNDLECIYSYFDPVAQQKYPFGTFKQNAENFKVEIKEYTCKGKVLKDSFIAWVQCEYTYKLPPRLMGIEIREQDRQRKDKSSGYWVYIKDQWRMVFQSFPGMNLIQW